MEAFRRASPGPQAGETIFHTESNFALETLSKYPIFPIQKSKNVHKSPKKISNFVSKYAQKPLKIPKISYFSNPISIFAQEGTIVIIDRTTNWAKYGSNLRIRLLHPQHLDGI